MNLLFSLHPVQASSEFHVSRVPQVLPRIDLLETGNPKPETAVPDCHSRPRAARHEKNWTPKSNR